MDTTEMSSSVMSVREWTVVEIVMIKMTIDEAGHKIMRDEMMVNNLVQILLLFLLPLLLLVLLALVRLPLILHSSDTIGDRYLCSK